MNGNIATPSIDSKNCFVASSIPCAMLENDVNKAMMSRKSIVVLHVLLLALLSTLLCALLSDLLTVLLTKYPCC
jgi:hypothetical protein